MASDGILLESVIGEADLMLLGDGIECGVEDHPLAEQIREGFGTDQVNDIELAELSRLGLEHGARHLVECGFGLQAMPRDQLLLPVAIEDLLAMDAAWDGLALEGFAQELQH